MRLFFELLAGTWLQKFLVATLITLTLTNPIGAQDRKPDPQNLDDCIDLAISEFILVDKTDKSKAWKLFNKYTDRERLGSKVYKNDWNDASKKWKDEAIWQYFTFLFSHSRQTSKGYKLVPESINKRLATEPERGAGGNSDYEHIVFSAVLITGENVTRKLTGAALVLKDTCKFIDLAVGGVWISNKMRSTEVDLALRQ
jgi:hypothetical protein